jgi:hypothetical protein
LAATQKTIVSASVSLPSWPVRRPVPESPAYTPEASSTTHSPWIADGDAGWDTSVQRSRRVPFGLVIVRTDWIWVEFGGLIGMRATATIDPPCGGWDESTMVPDADVAVYEPVAVVRNGGDWDGVPERTVVIDCTDEVAAAAPPADVPIIVAVIAPSSIRRGSFIETFMGSSFR